MARYFPHSYTEHAYTRCNSFVASYENVRSVGSRALFRTLQLSTAVASPSSRTCAGHHAATALDRNHLLQQPARSVFDTFAYATAVAVSRAFQLDTPWVLRAHPS